MKSSLRKAVIIYEGNLSLAIKPKLEPPSRPVVGGVKFIIIRSGISLQQGRTSLGPKFMEEKDLLALPAKKLILDKIRSSRYYAFRSLLRRPNFHLFGGNRS